MNRQSIHQQIDLLLNALSGQHKQFRDGEGTIQQVELDLLLQNTRQLYEAILLLNHNNALSSLDEVKTAVMQRILAEKRVVEKKADQVEVNQHTNPVNQDSIKPALEEVHPNTMEEVMIKAEAAQPADLKIEKTVKTKKLSGGVNATLFEGAHTLADNFEDEVTIHEHIASKGTGKTIAENLHRKPIRDLKAAIGINEKFLFINQLFDGNLQDYSEAVEKLNNAGDLAAAKQLIAADLASRFNWPDHDEHVKSFIDLVERRFIS
jgi:hypothetical protein